MTKWHRIFNEQPMVLLLVIAQEVYVHLFVIPSN